MVGRISELWSDIIDLIGPRNEWPRDLPKLFWGVNVRGTGTLIYPERFRLALFCYINGVSLDLLLEWCQKVKILRDNAARKHI